MNRSLLRAGCRRAALLIVSACLGGCSVPAGYVLPHQGGTGQGGFTISPASVSFSPGDASTVSASESGYSGTFSETDNCSGIITIAPLGQSQFTLTAVAPGLCSVTISDTNGHSGKVPISVQSIIIGGG